jgi:uncharacterized protein YndB with AHSA1/START domain
MTAPAAPRRRWTRIPQALLLAGLVLVGWLYVRGTWADAEERNPARVEDGPLAHLHRTADGRTEVRAAVLLAAPPERVWAVVTDYERYPEWLPYLTGTAVTRDENGVRLAGKARSMLAGYWDFLIDVRESADDGRRTAAWDHPHDKLRVNRGAWTVTDAGDGKTLLALTLDAEVADAPAFLLRNVFRHRLKQVMRAAASRLESQAAAPGSDR